MEKYRRHRPVVCLRPGYLTEENLYDSEVPNYKDNINCKTKCSFPCCQEFLRKK